LVDVVTANEGHASASDRLVHSVVGQEARYSRHSEQILDGTRTLELTVECPCSGIEITSRFTMLDDIAAIRSEVLVLNMGLKPIVLRSVTSLTAYIGGALTGAVRDWNVHHGLNDWLGEGRWVNEPLDDTQFPSLGEQLTTHNPRGEFSVISSGTWSTGKHLPVAGISSRQLGASWAWQIDHNGAWRWEIGSDTANGYLALSGPTDTDHQWTKVLQPGESFPTVPAVLALSGDFTTAVGELTKFRRRTRRTHPDNTTMQVVFNDYMNTLGGDPTADKLLPLVGAAAQVGAEIFCIDAGWYDDSGDWWDSVGEWRPSSTRFPDGFGRVIRLIRDMGMVPGLWLEPEVVGVRSPIANELPDNAFFQRHGQRLVEHGRYHLDLRHPAARAYLDDVVDRLVADFRVGYLKLDYNINPGAGTDCQADSVGAGLLDHNRAHLDWLDGILARHPNLILENCASGGMRSDFAMLSRLQLQSTSDQQDYLRYPPIAAAAPLTMLPEQAANWAYPQPSMSNEEMAFCLSTSLLGRFYLSGHIDQMSDDQRALVTEAVFAAKGIRSQVARSVPLWPLGLPSWDDKWVALGLSTGDNLLTAVWNRGSAEPAVLELPHLAGMSLIIDTVFPRYLPTWETLWDPTTARLHIDPGPTPIGARVFRLGAVTPSRRAQQIENGDDVTTTRKVSIQ